MAEMRERWEFEGELGRRDGDKGGLSQDGAGGQDETEHSTFSQGDDIDTV